MREQLIRCIMALPFREFIIMTRGGFQFPVSHPEAITFDPGVSFIVIYDPDGYASTFETDNIIALRRAGAPA